MSIEGHQHIANLTAGVDVKRALADAHKMMEALSAIVQVQPPRFTALTFSTAAGEVEVLAKGITREQFDALDPRHAACLDAANISGYAEVMQTALSQKIRTVLGHYVKSRPNLCAHKDLSEPQMVEVAFQGAMQLQAMLEGIKADLAVYEKLESSKVVVE